MSIEVKRVYDAPQAEDGARVLVDRLWPRGLSRDAAAIDAWPKECAPSDELRKWFAHDKAKWSEFKQRYFAEPKEKEEVLEPIRAMARGQRVTLLFGAADVECNNAVALQAYLSTHEPRGSHAGRTPRRSSAPRS